MHTPLYFGLAVMCDGHEVVNGIQHMSVGRGGSLLRSRVDQLLQVDVVTGKCIKRTGVGK